MKIEAFITFACFVLSGCFFMLTGCAHPNLEMPERLPSSIREYKHISLTGNTPHMADTGIHLNDGDLYSILATGKIDLNPNGKQNIVKPEEYRRLLLKIGDSAISFPLYQENGITQLSTFSGNLFLGLRDGIVNRYGKPRNPEWYYDNKGLFSIDIIVWETNDWSITEKFFERMKLKSPDNKAIADAYSQVNKIKDAIYFIAKKDSKVADETQALKPDEKKTPISSSETEFTFFKTNYQKPDAVAVVIGNRNYSNKDIPIAEFAHNDAEAIKRYLIETLGYREGNILFKTDVTKTQMDMLFGIESDHRGILDSYIKPGTSDVFIYYSGHGAPNLITKEAYFVPTDANPAMMALTGYSLNTFYKNLSLLEAKNITVVIDSCFSGGTDIGKTLIRSANPALIKLSMPVVTKNNITVITSSDNDQVSSWYPEKRHSMFTYFFLKAVTGEADTDKNKKVTIQEIFNYVSDKAEGVPYWAKRLHVGRIQTPTLQSVSRNAVFVELK
jgi:hypothetical protein